MSNTLLEFVGMWCVVIAVAVLATPAWGLLLVGLFLVVAANVTARSHGEDG